MPGLSARKKKTVTRPAGALPEIHGAIQGRKPVAFFRRRARSGRGAPRPRFRSGPHPAEKVLPSRIVPDKQDGREGSGHNSLCIAPGRR